MLTLSLPLSDDQAARWGAVAAAEGLTLDAWATACLEASATLQTTGSDNDRLGRGPDASVQTREPHNDADTPGLRAFRRVGGLEGVSS